MVRSKRTKLREVEEPPSEESTEPEMESKVEDEVEEPVAKKAKSDSEEPEEETQESVVTAEEVCIVSLIREIELKKGVSSILDEFFQCSAATSARSDLEKSSKIGLF